MYKGLLIACSALKYWTALQCVFPLLLLFISTKFESFLHGAALHYNLAFVTTL
jgi:hypothetical protein